MGGEEGVCARVCLDGERGRVSGRIKILVENSLALKNIGNEIYIPPLNKKQKQRWKETGGNVKKVGAEIKRM